jgi:translation initiation factor IF-2
LIPVEEAKKRLEVVLKCDSVGSQEAIIAGIHAIQEPKVEIKVIHTGVGSITKSDLFMALTGSRLVLGFDVGISPNIKRSSQEQGIEIRLHEVIYKLIDDLQKIARNLVPKEIEEKITGKTKVIALFKSSRKGIILGCDVLEGTLALGKKFRVVSAMGTVYAGKIESLHIGKDAVREARVGQQVGLKISDFKRAKVGDLVECHEKAQLREDALWRPKGGVFRP